jgi:hypothetical protein
VLSIDERTIGNGQVYGECKPTRNGADFMAFLRKAVKPHVGTDVHVVLDNLSTPTTPEVAAWPRQSIRRGTLTSVTVLIKQIRDYIDHWNTDPKPFQWTATADEILAKVQLVQTSIKKLVDLTFAS